MCELSLSLAAVLPLCLARSGTGSQPPKLTVEHDWRFQGSAPEVHIDLNIEIISHKNGSVLNAIFFKGNAKYQYLRKVMQFHPYELFGWEKHGTQHHLT